MIQVSSQTKHLKYYKYLSLHANKLKLNLTSLSIFPSNCFGCPIIILLLRLITATSLRLKVSGNHDNYLFIFLFVVDGLPIYLTLSGSLLLKVWKLNLFIRFWSVWVFVQNLTESIKPTILFDGIRRTEYLLSLKTECKDLHPLSSMSCPFLSSFLLPLSHSRRPRKIFPWLG